MLVALAQQRLDLAPARRPGPRRGSRPARSAHRARRRAGGAAQATARGLQRHHDHVVLVLAEAALALGREHADHGERHLADAHGSARSDPRRRTVRGGRSRRGSPIFARRAVVARLRSPWPLASFQPLIVEKVRLHALPAGRPVVLGDRPPGALPRMRAGHVLHFRDLVRGWPRRRSSVRVAAAAGAAAHAARCWARRQLMSSRFEPSPDTILSISACVPCPTETITITAAMPMITPSEVSALRIQLPRSANTAVRRMSPKVMPLLPGRVRPRAARHRASRRCGRRGAATSASWVISTTVWPSSAGA